MAISYDCDHLLALQLDHKLGFIEVYNGPGALVWERIVGKADLGRQRPISVAALRSLPNAENPLPQIHEFPPILPKVLEAVGGELQNGDQPGVLDGEGAV